jgi:hypothetical protein
MLVLQLHPEHCIGQRFHYHCHYFNRVFFAQSILSLSIVGAQFTAGN